MSEIISSLTASDWIELIGIIASIVTSIVAIVVSVKTLKQSSNAIIDSSRANIVFYIDTQIGDQQFLTIKNFGNSTGKIISIDIIPKPDYAKSPRMSNESHPLIIDYSNILLAPNQYIKSWFPFNGYPDKKFKVHIKYETLGKIYESDYSIDLSYVDTMNCLYWAPFDIPDEKHALVEIGNTLKRISEKF